MDEIVSEFVVESHEGLDQIDRQLIVLEESPDHAAVLEEIFRTLHTIKGTCGFLGFGELERLAHAAENLLSLLRDGALSMTSEIADALLATVGHVRGILASIEETDHEGDPSIDGIVDRLDALATPEAAALEAAVVAPADDTSIDVQTDDADVERIGDLLVDAGAAERTDVEIAAVEQSLGDSRKLGRILVDDGRAEDADVESAASSQKKRSVSESSIRVDVALLDRLMDLVGELVLSRNQIVQLATEHDDNGLGPAAQRLNLVTSELREGIMKTRLQPIDNVWANLPLVVRDLSHRLDKSVHVETFGRETELDRTILEAIKGPLTHIVRNMIDHGIESPAERVAAGKPEQGLLLLRASHEAGQVNIEISDDGIGMNPPTLAAKAVEKGVATAEQVSRMTEREMVDLIFEPGFSTADEVSSVSGRGVGMDVVKTNIEQIGGAIDLETEPGVGTTFKIELPLTLAIIPALVVGCDDSRYAIPQVNLLEVLRLESDDDRNRIEDLNGAPVYRRRGRLLPIVDLRDQLGCEPADRDTTNILVLRAKEDTFGLIVDRIEDTEEIVVKPLGRPVEGLDLFAGATILGDGRIALILDPVGLAGEANVIGTGATGSEPVSDAVDDTQSTALDDRALLLLGLGGADRVAIPLTDVERLEEFPPAALERSNGRTVVQYRGGIMPLVDLAPTIGLGGSAFPEATHVSVVVCSVARLTVGLAVDSILDIVAHAETVASIGHGVETVVIDGRVTDVIDAIAIVSSVLPMPRPTDEPPATTSSNDLAGLHSGSAGPTGV